MRIFRKIPVFLLSLMSIVAIWIAILLLMMIGVLVTE